MVQNQGCATYTRLQHVQQESLRLQHERPILTLLKRALLCPEANLERFRRPKELSLLDAIFFCAFVELKGKCAAICTMN